MRFVIRDREAGNVIEECTKIDTARKLLDLFENQDKADGTYEKDFYTTHTEDETKDFMDEAVKDSDNEYDNATLLGIDISFNPDAFKQLLI